MTGARLPRSRAGASGSGPRRTAPAFSAGGRVTFVLAGTIALAVGIVARIGYLNVTDHDFLKAQGDTRAVKTLQLEVHRGAIYDRRGQPLAMSVPAADITADPSLLAPQGPGFARLAKALGVTPTALAARLARSPGNRFAYLRRAATRAFGAQITQIAAEEKLLGVRVEDVYKRYYPAGEVAAHVVGRTNIDGVGQEGIERIYNEFLQGQPGSRRVLQDRRARTIKDLGTLSSPKHGQDLELSIDIRLQYVAHRELKAEVFRRRALAGSLVMLDAATGEVLAMVNEPSYNPNDRVTDHARMRNRAVMDLYEPGSTIKPLALVAALESGYYNIDSTVDTSPGWVRVGRHIIEDPRDRGVLSLTQIIAKSSQVGITKVAETLAPHAIPEVLRRVGFGDIVSLGWNTRSQPLPVVANDSLKRVTMAFGYGFAVSPVQLAGAYQVIASGGERHEISLLKKTQTSVGQRVVEEGLSAQLTEMLERAVDDEGTAPLARVPGYRVAGKTGTARKVGRGGYEKDRNVAFFAGFAPAQAPRLVMVVVIDEPQGEETGGGAVAGPVFGRVAREALLLLEAPPDLTEVHSA